MCPDAVFHRSCRFAILLVAAAIGTGVAAEANQTDTVQHHALAQRPGSARWSFTQAGGLTIEFIQRQLNQTQAFYQGRGFSPDVTQQIARACVMSVVARNLAANRTLRIDLADWRVKRDGHEQPLRMESDWQKEWAKSGVSQSARIAFRYSMLPTIQLLAPGDWMQGMITVNLDPGRHFDLHIYWTENGKPKQAWLHRLVCAAASKKEVQP